jgi:hypothetical protein
VVWEGRSRKTAPYPDLDRPGVPQQSGNTINLVCRCRMVIGGIAQRLASRCNTACVPNWRPFVNK